MVGCIYISRVCMATSKKASFLQLKLHVYKLSLQLYIIQGALQYKIAPLTSSNVSTYLLIIIFPLNMFDLCTLSAPKMSELMAKIAISCLIFSNSRFMPPKNTQFCYFAMQCQLFSECNLGKFIYSEKATKFCEISTDYLTGSTQDK